MAKAFVTVAKRLQEQDPPVQLAEVDCTSGTGTKICKKFNVKAYPTLQLFKQGKPDKMYEGTRDAKSMEEWLNTHAKIHSKRFSSYTDLNTAIKQSNEPTVIAIFSNQDDPLVEQWLKATKAVKKHWTYRDFELYHIYDDYASGKMAQLTAIGLDEGKQLRAPTIVLHRPKWLHNKHEPTDLVYKIDSKQDIAEWIFQKAYGTVMYRTRDNEEELKPPLIVAYYDLDFKEKPKRTHKWRNKLIEAAKKHTDITFAISSSQSYRKELRRQTLEPPKGDEKPLVVGYDNLGTLYLMRDEFSDEAFEEFIADFKKGEVAPHLKSQEPPEDNDQRLVKIGTGANFHTLVTQNKKDVFIDFYAPWCKHSQELEPTWEELARQLRDEPDIDIVKMDATANAVPSQFTAEKYPTVYFVPKNTKKPVLYQRGRHIHEFVMFLAEHATEEMRGFNRDGSIKSKLKTEL